MKQLFLYVLLIVFLITIGCKSQNKATNTIQTSSIDKKVDSILALMTLKEKAGQMLNIGLPAVLTGDYWDSRDSAIYNAEKWKRPCKCFDTGKQFTTIFFAAF